MADRVKGKWLDPKMPVYQIEPFIASNLGLRKTTVGWRIECWTRTLEGSTSLERVLVPTF